MWDLAVRVLHWSLVLSVAAAWLTRHSPGRWHEWLGYATLAIVAARTAWGFIGAGHAQFGKFMRSPAATAAYARAILEGREDRHLGHNPLGGWMVATLLAMISLVGFTGWLYTTDRFWGIAWVERRRLHLRAAPGKPACVDAARAQEKRRRRPRGGGRPLGS